MMIIRLDWWIRLYWTMINSFIDGIWIEGIRYYFFLQGKTIIDFLSSDFSVKGSTTSVWNL